MAGLLLLLRSASLSTTWKAEKLVTSRKVTAVDYDELDGRALAVVEGRRGVQVELYQPARGEWEWECECGRAQICEHAIALTMVLVRSQGGSAPVSAPTPSPVTEVEVVSTPATATGKGKTPAKAATKSPAKDDSQTSLAAAAEKSLGRPLDWKEKSFVRLFTNYHQAILQGNPITSNDLWKLGQYTAPTPGYRGFGQTPEPMESKLPQNQVQFWLAIQRFATEQSISMPPFLADIAKVAPPGPELLQFWRDQEIQKWMSQLEHSLPDLEELGHGLPPLEVRLVVREEGMELQTRTGTDSDWRTPDGKTIRQLLSRYQQDELELAGDSELLLAGLIDHHLVERSARIAYDEPEATQLLSRCLRQPSLKASICQASGEPVLQHAEPLRWRILPPAAETGDYQFELERSDQQPLGAPFARLPGRPERLLASSGLWKLPPVPSSFQIHRPNRVPAPAIESEVGLKLVASFKAPLPERLNERLQTIPLRPWIRASLLAGNPERNVAERLTLEAFGYDAENRVVERYLEAGWKTSIQHTPIPGRLVVYQRDRLAAVPTALEAFGAKWDVFASGWTIRVTKDFPERFTAWMQGLPASIETELSPELASLLLAPVEAQVSLSCEPIGVDWFDLSVNLESSASDLTPEELQLLLGARGGYVRLGKKGWRRLAYALSDEDEEQLARLGLQAREFSAEPQRLHALQLADGAARRFLPAAQAEAIQLRASEIQARVTPPVPSTIQAELRPYQVEGFHFLAYLAENRFGGVLADDMGLGKTLQTLTWLAWLRDRQPAGTPPGRILIVCPKSVAPNWLSEAERFLPGLRVTVWSGDCAMPVNEVLPACDALVVNYPQLRLLADQLARERWLAVIADEAQAVKNPDSQTAQALRQLQAEQRLALTGTPIENRLLDLWSLMAFAMPGALGNRSQFQKSFGKSVDALARRRLSSRLRPFLLRRTKSQVAQDLPERIEEDLHCELEGVQKSLYQAEYKKARALLLKIQTKADLDQFRFHFLTSLLRLRQICCHPALVDEKHRREASAKFEALFDLIEPILEQGQKVLIFSQFTSLLDLLRDAIRERSWTEFYLAGDTENRGDLVRDFSAHPEAAVFLISIKAGGFGLNLTAASYVVLFDPWWNPAVEAQAIDRTHRIGQVNQVIAYRLLVKGSVEEKIRALQSQKKLLANDILGEERFSQSLTLDDLQVLFSAPEATV